MTGKVTIHEAVKTLIDSCREHLRFTNYGMTVFWSDTMVAGDIKEFPARDVVAAGRGTTDQQLIDFRDFVK